MRYQKSVPLRDGSVCLLRHASAADTEDVMALYRQAHSETDYLLSYPDEGCLTHEREEAFLTNAEADPRAIELLAFVDGRLAASAGIAPVGTKDKVRHRADLGISVLKEYWHLGIGRALMEACISCAREAGYTLIELQAVAENTRAIALYSAFGFTEYGRMAKGFRSRSGLWQELVFMQKEL